MNQDNIKADTTTHIDTKPQKKKMKTGKKVTLIVLFSILGILLAIAVTFIVMIFMGKNALLDNNETGLDISTPSFVEIKDDIIYYNGHKYKYNKNMTSTLFMGIDKRSLEDTGNVGEGGQADALFLMALDTETGKPTVFNISRDTMTDINVYDSLGQFVRTENKQICLSYAYGDGKQGSCKNTAVAVSRMFYGIPINSYVSIDLDAISILNDEVDGIELTVLEDLTETDSALIKGKKVTLIGDQAETYVRTRNMKDVDANNQRMKRQQQYVTAYIQKTIDKTKESLSLPLDLYNCMEDYMVTSIDPAKVSFFAYTFLSNGFTPSDMVTVPGTVAMGKDYAEFTVEQEPFYEMILDTFYQQID